jgi:hypothetical protein
MPTDATIDQDQPTTQDPQSDGNDALNAADEQKLEQEIEQIEGSDGDDPTMDGDGDGDDDGTDDDGEDDA